MQIKSVKISQQKGFKGAPRALASRWETLFFCFLYIRNIPIVAFWGIKALGHMKGFTFRPCYWEMRQRNGDRCTRVLLDYSLMDTGWSYSLHQIKIINLLYTRK